MTLQFQSLSEELRPLAIAAAQHFKNREGTRSIRAEAEIAPELRYCPTLIGESRDKSLLAIEFTDTSPPGALHRFVNESRTR